MLIDAHAHMEHYREDLEDALQEIRDLRILTLSQAMDVEGYRKARESARECPYILPSFGIHPWNAHRYADRLGELDTLILESPMLGEIGLDFHFVEESERHPQQERVLSHFLEAAGRQEKLVNLHTKGAEERVLRLLRDLGPLRFIIHWYSGPLELLEAFLELGAFFTVGVAALASPHVQGIARRLPEDRLLTETDNPGAYEWQAQSRGMPSVLLEVIHKLAELRGTTPEAVERTVEENFTRLIRGDPHLGAFLQRLAAAQAEG
jgi:TatD DNase family protein